MDALCYVDGFTEEDRLLAEGLIRSEMLKMPKPDYTLPSLPELTHIPSKKPVSMNAIDPKRYALPEPTNVTSVQEWEKAVNNAKAQRMHQQARLLNLELISQLGANAWKLHLFQLEQIMTLLKKELALMEEQKDALNRTRKHEQELGIYQLNGLEERFKELVNACLAIEFAIQTKRNN